MIDYYKILNVDDKSSRDEIISKYNQLKKAYQKEDKKSKENKKNLELLEESYSVLSDFNKRKAYDLACRLSKENEELSRENKNNPNLKDGSKISENLLLKEAIRIGKRRRRKRIGLGILYSILIIPGIYFSYKNQIIFNLAEKLQSASVEKEPTISITSSPTISEAEDKQIALDAAEAFGEWLGLGNEEAKNFIDPDSQYYQENIETIDEIIHDAKKEDYSLRIYDLSITSYTSTQAIASGYLDSRTFYDWLKYHVDIYLNKVGDVWLVDHWTMEKT